MTLCVVLFCTKYRRRLKDTVKHANLRERLLWGGDTRKFHTQFGAGVKIIIN